METARVYEEQALSGHHASAIVDRICVSGFDHLSAYRRGKTVVMTFKGLPEPRVAGECWDFLRGLFARDWTL